ncbi:MAG: hypothetical protein EAZ55_09145 [Cytophagales bacterium]|nr:MAG: hypothetical protein EAZ55_09145 [Cytophagales bacterium]
MKTLTSYLFFLGLIFNLQNAYAQKPITLEEVQKYLNQPETVLIEATIAEVKTADKITYINLGDKHPNQKLAIIIFDTVLFKLKPLLFQQWENRRIKITGQITDYKGNQQPQIILENSSQIEFLE